jgi:hypothetical protein
MNPHPVVGTSSEINYAILNLIFIKPNSRQSRSRWPRGLRRRSADACLLKLRVRTPPGPRMSCVLCCQVELGVALRTLVCSNCVFELHQGHGCLLCFVLSGRVRRRSADACLLKFRVRTPPGPWMSVVFCVVR